MGTVDQAVPKSELGVVVMLGELQLLRFPLVVMRIGGVF